MREVEKEVMAGTRWQSRALAFATAVVLLPVTWVFLLQLSFRLIFTGDRFELTLLFGLMAVMTLLTAEFSRRLANRLVWFKKTQVVRNPKPEWKPQPKKPAPAKPKSQRPRMSRQRFEQLLPFCEKRATGNRVIAEAQAFQFGAARKHLEAAPWYRN